MLYRHLIEGGFWWMLPIYIMWIAVIILTVVLAMRLIKDRQNGWVKPLSEIILFAGSFAFLIGILGQAIGIMQMMECIGEMGNIAPAIIARGFLVSMLTTMYGLVLFVVSLFIWFLTRRLSRE